MQFFFAHSPKRYGNTAYKSNEIIFQPMPRHSYQRNDYNSCHGKGPTTVLNNSEVTNIKVIMALKDIEYDQEWLKRQSRVKNTNLLALYDGRH